MAALAAPEPQRELTPTLAQHTHTHSPHSPSPTLSFPRSWGRKIRDSSHSPGAWPALLLPPIPSRPLSLRVQTMTPQCSLGGKGGIRELGEGLGRGINVEAERAQSPGIRTSCQDGRFLQFFRCPFLGIPHPLPSLAEARHQTLSQAAPSPSGFQTLPSLGVANGVSWGRQSLVAGMAI